MSRSLVETLWFIKFSKQLANILLSKWKTTKFSRTANNLEPRCKHFFYKILLTICYTPVIKKWKTTNFQKSATDLIPRLSLFGL